MNVSGSLFHHRAFRCIGRTWAMTRHGRAPLRVIACTAMPRTKRAPSAADDTPRLSLRLDLGGGLRLGPGKAALLEEIGRSGSISAAGRALAMSYRRAWELVENLNQGFGTPVVEAVAGGAGGGGARLTATGEAVLRHYRAVETEAGRVAAAELDALQALRREQGEANPAKR